ncbi:MAG: hypothetical protein LUI13_12370 [Lachnospiraceae bacterium]|nr:hypothetical protein [Lachnospiraceae bacterium]
MAADREVQAADQEVREAVSEAREEDLEAREAAAFGEVRECPRHRAEDGEIMVIGAEDAAAFRFSVSLR